MGEKLEGPIVRPQEAHLIPDEPNVPTLRFTMTGGARQATPLICENLQRNIEIYKIIQQTYADPLLIAEAEARQLGAKFADAKVYPDLNGSVQSYDSAKDKTYHDLAKEIWKAEIASRGLSIDGVAAVAGAESYLGLGGAVAGTDRFNCQITDAKPFEVDGTCLTEIELLAIREHEEIHSASCDEKNNKYVVSDAYAKWINHPSNLAAEEFAAYQVALDELVPWFESHCGG